MPKFEHSENQAKAAEPTALERSYLDVAVRAAIEPTVRTFTSGDKAAGIEDEISTYSRAFIKTAPLFMKGKLALGGLALSYAADQAKVGDTAAHQLTDATLGLGKAAALKGSFALMEKRALSPAMSGVQLGIIGRTAEAGLTRENYVTKTGEYSLTNGLSTTLKTAFNPGNLAVDALTFGAADVLWGRAYMKSRGAIRFDTPLKHTLAAGTMGTASGTGNEFVRQWQSDEQFNLPLILQRGLASGIVTTAAGRVGGLQSERHMRLNVKDGPDAVAEARSTPFQLGKIADARQAALRDGEFTPGREVANLQTPTLKGTIKTAEGEIPVLFRPHTGTEPFAVRMQSEIAGYGLAGKIKLENSMPVSVARTVEVNGKPVHGYVQELQGKNLLEVVNPGGQRSLFKPPPKKVIDEFVQNKPLFESYQEAWAKRLVMGEWDNHALNFIADKTPGKVAVKNIDLGDGLRPATSQLDLIPRAGLRRGYENLSQYLYEAAAKKPLPVETVTKLNDFVTTYNNPAGKLELQGLGMTPQQVEGAVGRATWLAKNGRLPKGDAEPTTYQLVQRVSRILRGRPSMPSLIGLHNLDD